MKKRNIAALMLAAALSLSACTGADKPENTDNSEQQITAGASEPASESAQDENAGEKTETSAAEAPVTEPERPAVDAETQAKIDNADNTAKALYEEIRNYATDMDTKGKSFLRIEEVKKVTLTVSGGAASATVENGLLRDSEPVYRDDGRPYGFAEGLIDRVGTLLGSDDSFAVVYVYRGMCEGLLYKKGKAPDSIPSYEAFKSGSFNWGGAADGITASGDIWGTYPKLVRTGAETSEADGPSEVINSSEWLRVNTLSDDDIAMLDHEMMFFQFANVWFKENEIKDEEALTFLYSGNGGMVDPFSDGTMRSEYVDDVLGKYSVGNYKAKAYRIPEAAVDEAIRCLFDIEPTHRDVMPDNGWLAICYYYDGYYYLNEGGVGGFDYIRYDSYEALSDGRFVVHYNYLRSEYDSSIDDWAESKIGDIYILTSVNLHNGRKYMKLHAICQNRSDIAQ